jgi:hypothetical protein
LFVKKLKLLAVPVFGVFSIFRPYFRDGYYILFIFLFYDYRVSLAPVACGALNLKCAAGGGKGHNQLTPPGPRLAIAKFWQ